MSDDTHGQWSEEIGDVVGTHPFASHVAKHAKIWRGCIPQVRPEAVYTLLVGDILPPGTQSGTFRSHTIALDAQGWRDLAAAATRAAEMMETT